MRKTGLLCVAFVALAAGAVEAARAESCADLRSRLAALDMADRSQWEAPGVPQDPYAIERQRLGVLKALAANRCQSPEARRNTRAGRLFSGLFGKRPFRNAGRDEFRLFGRNVPDRGGLPSGSYRTLCVRSCDGYYFPISFAARGQELQRDEMACRALCPGQDVALYVQPGGEGAPSVSLAGVPYTALPTAFRYRSEYDRACTCGPVDATLAAAFQAFSVPPPAADRSDPSDEAAAGVPTPVAKSRADDPDTAANRLGRFSVVPAAPGRDGQAVYARAVDGRMVRLVGPAEGYLAE